MRPPSDSLPGTLPAGTSGIPASDAAHGYIRSVYQRGGIRVGGELSNWPGVGSPPCVVLALQQADVLPDSMDEPEHFLQDVVMDGKAPKAGERDA